MTPLHIASLNLHIKIVSVLLKENQVGKYPRKNPWRSHRPLVRPVRSLSKLIKQFPLYSWW